MARISSRLFATLFLGVLVSSPQQSMGTHHRHNLAMDLSSYDTTFSANGPDYADLHSATRYASSKDRSSSQYFLSDGKVRRQKLLIVLTLLILLAVLTFTAATSTAKGRFHPLIPSRGTKDLLDEVCFLHPICGYLASGEDALFRHLSQAFTKHSYT